MILSIFRHFNIIKIVTHLEVTPQNVKQPKTGRNSGHVRNSDKYGIWSNDVRCEHLHSLFLPEGGGGWGGDELGGWIEGGWGGGAQSATWSIWATRRMHILEESYAICCRLIWASIPLPGERCGTKEDDSKKRGTLSIYCLYGGQRVASGASFSG